MRRSSYSGGVLRALPSALLAIPRMPCRQSAWKSIYMTSTQLSSFLSGTYHGRFRNTCSATILQSGVSVSDVSVADCIWASGTTVCSQDKFSFSVMTNIYFYSSNCKRDISSRALHHKISGLSKSSHLFRSFSYAYQNSFSPPRTYIDSIRNLHTSR